ncbi:MAG: hypothetical protein HLUCCX10_12635 [Algoriphagus marincola HL-49]|uniref:Uncharacterized protein n=1 Tax=Algoriphagus marincola HL-49 TaxID=1305737 RepID=A0A0P8BUH5_9BACT|nr:MAG: hypothetical protein HLUCCX10_12635 [Algoriphagus marincola HL-49]
MKKSLWCILALALTFSVSKASFGQTVLDQETITDLNKTPNYVFGVKDEDGLKSALSVYDTFLKNGVNVENFEIVVKGPVVKTMVKDSELEKYFEKYKGKVRVSICGIAMKRLGVSEEQLFSGLDVVDTYTIRILQLQALGYNSISY